MTYTSSSFKTYKDLNKITTEVLDSMEREEVSILLGRLQDTLDYILEHDGIMSKLWDITFRAEDIVANYVFPVNIHD